MSRSDSRRSDRVAAGRSLVARLAALAPTVAGAEYPGPTPLADAVDRALSELSPAQVAGAPDLLDAPRRWADWARRAPRAAWRAVERAARRVTAAAQRAARRGTAPVRAVARELMAWSRDARSTAAAAVRELSGAVAEGTRSVYRGAGLGLAIGIPLLLWALTK